MTKEQKKMVVLSAKLIERLDHEIFGLLCDLGLAQQRTDEFMDQEELVERFLIAWRKVITELRKKVIRQIEKGKTEIKL